MQFDYEEYTVIPLMFFDSLFAMSKRVGSWPALEGGYTTHFEYITHATPWAPSGSSLPRSQ